MAISEKEKNQLLGFKEALAKRSGPEFVELRRTLGELDLRNISAEDLKALSNPLFVIGVNFNSIDTSPPFTTTDMNEIAPGAIDVNELKVKMSNTSMVQGRVVDIVDTQSGLMAVSNEIRLNIDVEDIVESKVKSQGVNLQLENQAEDINAESSSTKEIPSKFVEKT